MAAARPSPFALGFAPLVLRLVLGITFAWTGLAKWMGTATVQGEDAAILANLGVLSSAAPAQPPTAPAPATPLPEPNPKPHAAAPAGGLLLAQAAAPPTTAPSTPVTSGPPVATAADFPVAVPVRALWGIALAVYHAAHPVLDPGTGQTMGSMWPKALGEGLWPKVFAITVFVCELGGGVLLLVGFFTRLAALGTVSVMLGAIWLTQVGPAVQSGKTLLGFLPAHDLWNPQPWLPLMLQASLLGSGLALMCLGSGALAIDRALGVYRYTAPSSSASKSGGASGNG